MQSKNTKIKTLRAKITWKTNPKVPCLDNKNDKMRNGYDGEH
jgi:hypothetical protein